MRLDDVRSPFREHAPEPRGKSTVEWAVLGHDHVAHARLLEVIEIRRTVATRAVKGHDHQLDPEFGK